MIVKTTALALRIQPYSRTSRIVTWLTPDRGRVVTAIKGASRAKSAFLGQYDLAMRCELLFYRREHDGVHVARECTPLDIRPNLRADWRAAVAAGYLCELASRVTEPMLDALGTFNLLDRTLTQLDGGAPPIPVILSFEFDLLETLGLAPDFHRCGDCDQGGDARPCRFSLPSGRLRCIHSPTHQPGGASVALDDALLGALRAWQRGPAPAAAPTVPAPSGDLTLAVRRFLGMFMQCHLDLPMTSRQAAFAWLDTARPA